MSHSQSLQQLYASHEGKATDKWSSYLDAYDHVFQQFRDEAISLLEIGIQNGGSLEIWSQYFQNATHLAGCDNDPKCGELTYDDSRITVFVGDATERAVSERILAHCSSYDLVIDDGSHRSGDIIRAFLAYFSAVKPGGLYVVEDIHCSYWDGHEGGLFYPYSSISFFKALIDIVNYESWGTAHKRSSLLQAFADKYEVQIEEELLSQIHSVEFINSVCFIRKSISGDTSIGVRVLAGIQDSVVSVDETKRGKRQDFFPSQELNAWANRDAPRLDELLETQARMQAQLEEADARIKELDAKIAELQSEAESAQESLEKSDSLLIQEREQKARLRDEVSDHASRLSASQQDAHHLRSQLSLLENSRTWRYTKPLRTILSKRHGPARGADDESN